jgi:peptide/nickel transport system substrate-binding protein
MRPSDLVDGDGEPGGVIPSLGRRGLLQLAATGVAVAGMPGIARGGTPKRGGTLKHIGLEPASFDVHASVACETQLLSSFVRRTLFKFAHGAHAAPSDFTLLPDLAMRADASKDGRLYTITLREGVRWEQRPPLNGRPLTAADAQYSLDRARRLSPYASLLGPIEGIEVSGPRQLRVHLCQAFAPFLQVLAEPWTAIVPFEIEDRLGDFKSAQSLVGCGPFVLDRYERGIKAVFARNPNYYQQGLPRLDRVDWILLQDQPTALALFRAGELDIPFHDARLPRAELSAPTRATRSSTGNG